MSLIHILQSSPETEETHCHDMDTHTQNYDILKCTQYWRVEWNLSSEYLKDMFSMLCLAQLKKNNG